MRKLISFLIVIITASCLCTLEFLSLFLPLGLVISLALSSIVFGIYGTILGFYFKKERWLFPAIVAAIIFQSLPLIPLFQGYGIITCVILFLLQLLPTFLMLLLAKLATKLGSNNTQGPNNAPNTIHQPVSD